MGVRRGFWVVCVAVCLLLGVAPPARAQTRFDAGNEHYESGQLPNGLRVYLAEDHRVPLVAISIVYDVGATSDPLSSPGLSELVAELLPKLGTRHLPSGPNDLIEAAGFYPWSLVTEARDADTRLRLVVPAAAIDLALFIEAERMGFAADGLRAWALDSAKTAVTSRRAKAKTSALVGDWAMALAYGPEDPFGRIGRAPQLDGVTLAALSQRLRSYYTVANARLSIAGDFDAKRLMPVVKQLFGPLQGKLVPAVKGAGASGAASQKHAEVRGAHARPGVLWVWRTAPYLSPDDIALDVAARYLKHRLSQKLANASERADAYAQQSSEVLHSKFTVYLPVAEGSEQSAAERVARDEIDAIAAGKVDSDELELAKATITQEMASTMDTLVQRAQFMTSYASYDGNSAGFSGHLGMYLGLTAQGLSDVVRRQLGQPAVVLQVKRDDNAADPGVIDLPPPTLEIPELQAVAELADTPSWHRPPAAVAQPRFDPPKAYQLEGVPFRALFMPRSGLPLLKLRVALNWEEAVPVPEVRRLLSALLLRARPGGRPALKDRLADIGAKLEQAQNKPAMSLTVTVLADKAEQAAVILREALQQEHFEQSQLESERQDLSKAMESAAITDWQRLDRWQSRALYPKGHREHFQAVENSERVALLRSYDLKRLEAWWKSERRSDRLTVSIVGPIDEATAKRIAATVSPGWAPAQAGKNAKPGVLAPRTLLVDVPSASDVLVEISWPVSAYGLPGFADALGLRWSFYSNGGNFSTALHDSGGVKTNDSHVNVQAGRSGGRIVFSTRVAKKDVVGLFKALALHAERLQKGAFTWDGVQASRRAAVELVTKKYEGIEGCLTLLGNQADLDVPLSSTEDMYLLAQRINRASLTKAASVLAPANATVTAYGALADVKDELERVGFPKAMLVSAPAPALTEAK